MNWVGGIRQRVRQKNERKIQREFFERQRRAAKISKIKPELGKNRNSSENIISQDLLFLYPLNGGEKSGSSSLSYKRPVNFVDLRKRKHSRIQHNLKLGPDSPDEHQKSILDDDRECDSGNHKCSRRSGANSITAEHPETPLPRCMLEKHIVEAERKATEHASKDAKKSQIHPDSNIAAENTCGSNRPTVNTASRAESTPEGKDARKRAPKRYFPQKKNTNVEENYHLVDHDNTNRSTFDRRPNYGRYSVICDRILTTEDSQLVPNLSRKNFNCGEGDSGRRQFDDPKLDDWIRKVCHGGQTPKKLDNEKSGSPDEVWQKSFELVSVSQVTERKSIFPARKEKHFPGINLNAQHPSLTPSKLHQSAIWRRDDVLVESSGHLKTRFTDKSLQGLYDVHESINENFDNSAAHGYEFQTQCWDKKRQVHHYPHSLVEHELKRRKCPLIDCGYNDELEQDIPTFTENSSHKQQEGALQSDHYPLPSLDNSLEKLSKFDDDSEEDRFRQAIFKQKPPQQPALEMKDIGKQDLDVPHEIQKIEQDVIASSALEMPQSVPEAYVEVMEMGDGAGSNDQRSISGDNESDIGTSIEDMEPTKTFQYTPINGTWEEVAYNSPTATKDERKNITLASLSEDLNDEDVSRKSSQCLPSESSQSYNAKQIDPETAALPGFKRAVATDGVNAGIANGIDRISTEVQTEDLLCQNCGCTICSVLDEIGSTQQNDPLKESEDVSHTVSEADGKKKSDARKELDPSPKPLAGPENDGSEHITGTGAQNISLRHVTLPKSLKVGITFVDAGRFETNDNMTMEEVAEKSDTSPAASPCVIQTRSKTAKRNIAK